MVIVTKSTFPENSQVATMSGVEGPRKLVSSLLEEFKTQNKQRFKREDGKGWTRGIKRRQQKSATLTQKLYKCPH